MNKTAFAVITSLFLAACAQTPTSAPAPAPAPTPAPAPVATPACLQLQVARLKAGQGALYAAAYTSADSFFKQAAWMNRSEAKADTVVVDVCGVPGSEIAFTVFQDLNGNGKLDMNPMGIPTEPYGTSGKPVLGRPTWSDAKVPAAAGRMVRIEL